MFKRLGLFDGCPSGGLFVPSGEVWTPRKLANVYSQFFWAEPSLSPLTIWQGATGAVPVTAAGQVTGLLLDQSKGLALGPELVVNGTFNSDVTGWTASAGDLTWSSGQAVWSGTINAAQYIDIYRNVGASNSALYFLQADVTAISGGPSVYMQVHGGTRIVPIALTAVGKATANIKNTSANGNAGITFYNQTGSPISASVTFDNISVREILGAVATQATTADKPTYQVSPQGVGVLQHDTTDELVAAFASSFTGLGPNLAVGGTFDSGMGGWIGPNWTWGGGKVTKTPGTTNSLRLDALTVGKTYYLFCTVSGRTAGSLGISAGQGNLASLAGNGLLSATGVCAVDTFLRATPIVEFDGSVDDFYCYEVHPTASVYYANQSGVQQVHGVPIHQSYALPGKPASAADYVYGWIITPTRPDTATEDKIVRYLARKAGL